jgi:hypothetical protein
VTRTARTVHHRHDIDTTTRAAAHATPLPWLSDGWVAVQAEGWQAPGYWRQQDDLGTS